MFEFVNPEFVTANSCRRLQSSGRRPRASVIAYLREPDRYQTFGMALADASANLCPTSPLLLLLKNRPSARA